MKSTATEYAVLYQLAAQAPNVLTLSLLLKREWGPERVGEGWLLRNVVKVLRHKLGATPRTLGIYSPYRGSGTECWRGGTELPGNARTTGGSRSRA